MSLPRWVEAKITFGNIITIGVMVVGFFMWGAKIEARVDDLSKTVNRLELSDNVMTGKIESTREQAVARQEAVLTRLTRIETILERLEKSGRL